MSSGKISFFITMMPQISEGGYFLQPPLSKILLYVFSLIFHPLLSKLTQLWMKTYILLALSLWGMPTTAAAAISFLLNTLVS